MFDMSTELTDERIIELRKEAMRKAGPEAWAPSVLHGRLIESEVRALADRAAQQEPAETFSLYDFMLPSAADFLSTHGGADVPEGWHLGWDAARDRTALLVRSVEAAIKQGRLAAAPSRSGGAAALSEASGGQDSVHQVDAPSTPLPLGSEPSATARDAARFRMLLDGPCCLGVFVCDMDGIPSDSLKQDELLELLDREIRSAQ